MADITMTMSMLYFLHYFTILFGLSTSFIQSNSKGMRNTAPCKIGFKLFSIWEKKHLVPPNSS